MSLYLGYLDHWSTRDYSLGCIAGKSYDLPYFMTATYNNVM